MKFLKSLFASANVFTLNSSAAKSFTEGWPQIKSYYETLSKAFHAAERGNLTEIKLNSETLVQESEALSIEGMPAEYRNPKILETLLNLKKQTKVVNFQVKENVMDSEIKQSLTKLNEIFHRIVELCLSEK